MRDISIWASLAPHARILIYLHSARESWEWGGRKLGPEDLTQKGMAAALGVSVPRLSKLLTQLIRDGLVASSRVRIPTLRRSPLSYSLTDTGSKLAARELSGLLSRKVEFESLDGTVTRTRLKKLCKLLRMEGNFVGMLKAASERGRLSARALKEKPYWGEPQPPEPELVDLRNAIQTSAHFVGRKAQLAELSDFLADEKARLFSLTGPAAIGKTSLVSRFVKSAVTDFSVAFHACREWDTLRNTLEPVAELMARRGRKRLQYLLHNELNPITVQQAADLLKQDLRGLRALLVFEDLHKLAFDYRPLLKFLLTFASQEEGTGAEAQTRIKLLTTSREPLVGVFDHREVMLKELVRETELGGLTDAEVAELLEIEKSTSMQAKRVRELTRGNPLFIELMMRLGVGGAVKEFGKFVESEVIAKLSPDERAVLGCLSVFKIPVPFGALQIPQATSQSVERMVKLGIVTEAPPGTFSTSDIVIETVYRSLKLEERRTYHFVAAQYHMSLKTEENIAAALRHLILADRMIDALELGVANVKTLIRGGFSNRLDELVSAAGASDLPQAGVVALCKVKSERALAAGEWRTAQLHLERALAMAKGNTQEEGRILAAIAHALREQASYDRSLAKYLAAERAALKVYDIPTLAEIYRGTGKVHWRKGAFKEAVRYMKKSLDFLKASEMEMERGETFIDLGLVYNCIGKYEEAIDHYNRAIELFKKRKWIHPMARAYNNLAVQYLDLRDYDNAIKAWMKCYYISRKTNNKKGLLTSLTNISDPLSRQGKFNKALKYLKEAVDIAHDTGDNFGLIGVYSNYGQVYAKMREWNQSYEYFEKSINLIKKLNMPYDFAIILFHYGESLKMGGQWNKARATLMEALRLFRKCKARKRVEEVRDLLRDIPVTQRPV